MRYMRKVRRRDGTRYYTLNMMKSYMRRGKIEAREKTERARQKRKTLIYAGDAVVTLFI